MFKLSRPIFNLFVLSTLISTPPAFAHKHAGDAIESSSNRALRAEDGRGTTNRGADGASGGAKKLRGLAASNGGTDTDVSFHVLGNEDETEDPVHDVGAGATGDDAVVVDEDLVRVVVMCPSGVSHEQCIKDIEALTADAGVDTNNSISIVHDLDTIDAVALSLSLSDMPVLNGYDYYEDLVREPLYIHDSVVVEGADADNHAGGRNLQVGSQRRPYGIDMVNAPLVWEQYKTKGEGVTVCVLDTGIVSDHEDFDIERLTGYNGREAVTPWDADGNGHGTHVSGTIGASDNTVGVVGVAPGANVFTVRVFNDRGVFSSDLMKAAAECQNAGADIISMSLGGGGSNSRERQFFEKLYSEGVLSVAAAGNSGSQGNSVNYPAAYDIVVSVAAVDSSKRLASFSTRNSRVDIAAPGVNVRSTWNDGRYASISGTSMACPHVSGVAALLKSYNKDLTTQELFEAMTSTAEDRGAAGKDSSYGEGIVDALGAMKVVADSTDNGNGGGDGGGDETSGDEDNGGGDVACKEIRVDIQLDRFPGDITHSVRNRATDAVLWLEDNYSQFQRDTQTVCVDPTLCWRYEMVDSYGDGLEGNRELVLTYDGTVVYRGGNFGTGGVRDFGEGCGSN